MMLAFATKTWSQEQTIFLWPNGNPEPTTFDRPEYDPTTDADRMKAGKVTVRFTNVSKPSMTIYPAKPSSRTGVGLVAFPGGGYDHLAWNIEGTEVCEWAQSIGITCAAVKYRVPERGVFPGNPADLEDAQQAMRIFRSHAQEWGVDPSRIGIIGFSAGGGLAALLSKNYEYQGKSVPPSDVSAKPDFQMLLYPGGLTHWGTGKVADNAAPDQNTPPTFITQAINDPAARVDSTLTYFVAAKNTGVSCELHLFAEGKHGYGLRRTEYPVTGWPVFAETWLRTIKMLPSRSDGHR